MKKIIISLAVLTLVACGGSSTPDPIVEPETPEVPVTPPAPTEPETPVEPEPVVNVLQLDGGITSKTIPSCTPIQLVASPVEGESFVSEYDVAFSIATGGNVVANSEVKANGNESVLITTDDVTTGTEIVVTATYNDGSNEHVKTLTYTVEENLACYTPAPDVDSTYTLDANFEATTLDPLWTAIGGSAFGEISLSNEGVIGSAILWNKIAGGANAFNNGFNYDLSNNSRDWSEANFFDQLSTAPNQGRQIKISAWVKVTQETAADYTLLHGIYPESSIDGANIGARRAAGVILEATITAAENNQWVYKEFTVSGSDPVSNTYTIPTTWRRFSQDSPAPMVAEFRGFTSTVGTQVSIDEYSLVISGELSGKTDPVIEEPTLVTMNVSFVDPIWDGVTLPAGQECKKNGGDGSTPEMSLTNVPAGTVEFQVEYNDLDFRGEETGGFHGIIGYTHAGGTEATLIKVPGDIDTGYPTGTRLIQNNKGFGAWTSLGYLPPCSVASQTHRYAAKIFAVDADGNTIGEGDIQLANY